MTKIWIGLDDTDTAESPGTGRLAREIAAHLDGELEIPGVTRHQLLVDPRIPYTSHNSSAAILVESSHPVDPVILQQKIQEWMLAAFQAGSDPGLCILVGDVPQAITEFGQRARHEIVSQTEARRLAQANQILLDGLGGTQDGVIGALAAVGLAASGEDGRYILVGNIRDLSGLQPVSLIINSGIPEIRTLNGALVRNGRIQTDRLRPARRGGRPVAFVEWQGDHWEPLKLD